MNKKIIFLGLLIFLFSLSIVSAVTDGDVKIGVTRWYNTVNTTGNISGNIAIDKAGISNATFTTGMSCNATSCALGTGTLNLNSAFTASNQTVIVWIRTSTTSTEKTLVSNTAGSAFMLEWNWDQQYRFGCYDGSATTGAKSANVISDNTLQMLTVTYDSGVVHFYKNGTNADNVAGTNAVAITTNLINRNQVGGQLFMVSFWNRSLSSSEISYIYGKGEYYDPFASSTPPSTPTVSFVSPTPATETKYYNQTQKWIGANISVTNVLGSANGTINLYNSTGIYQTILNTTGLNFSYNFTNLPAGAYYLNATVTNGTANISTETRTVYVYALVQNGFNLVNNSNQSSQFMNVSWNVTSITPTGTGINMTGYNVSLYNSSGLIRQINSTLGSSYYWNVYAENLSLDHYVLSVKSYDTEGNIVEQNISFNLKTNALLNITAFDSSTGGSISNLSVNVTDLNSSIVQVWNTSGSVLQVDIVKGNNYSLFFDVPNYAYDSANYSANTSTFQALNKSLTKTNSISINIYDESSLALITNSTTGGDTNVTFINTFTSVTYNTSTGLLFVSNLSAGFYEVKFNAPLYNQRSYFITVTNRSTQTLNAYLSLSSITLLLTYTDKETGDLVEGCGIVIAKIINGSWTTIASGFTDITGRYQSSVSTNTNYRFSSTCSNYEDKTFNLNPVIFSSYTIRLTKIQSSGSQLDFTNINVYISNTSFSNYNNNSFAWQISSPAGTLESFGYNLHTQCKNISSYSGVNAYGGTNSAVFNLSCASTSDYVTLDYNYTLSNGSARTFKYTYPIRGNASASSFEKNIDEHYGMGLFERSFIVVIIIIVVAGIITKFSNIVAGLAGGMLVGSYLSYIGFIEWWLIAPSLLVGFVLITSWSQTR